MHATNFLTTLAVVLGFSASALAAPQENDGFLRTRQNGLRGCIGGAISCEYAKGRCAKPCGDGSSLSSACDCPDGTPDNPYTGAACIDIFRAAGRHGC